LLKSLIKGRGTRVCSRQNSDALHFAGFLRARRKRPRDRRAADKCDELAPLHVRLKFRRPHRIGSNEYFDRGWKRLRYCNMRFWPTSGLGQSRHSNHAPITSGLPPKADNFRAGRYFAYVPRAAVEGRSRRSRRGRMSWPHVHVTTPSKPELISIGHLS